MRETSRAWAIRTIKVMGLLCFATTSVFFVLTPMCHAIHAETAHEDKSEVAPSDLHSKEKRIFIFVDRLDSDGIVSEDGRLFRFSSDTKITGKFRPGQKKQVAELVFSGDRLIYVNVR